MQTIKVTGGRELKGHVYINGSKNATLPILASAFLFENAQIQLDNIPDITDVQLMLEVLTLSGIKVKREEKTVLLTIPSKEKIVTNAPEHLVSRMRATLLIIGPLLATKKVVNIALPGGCSIGYRPVDLHISSLKTMGAEIELQHGDLQARTETGLKPVTINLDIPSVGATENIIMAAVLTKGTTIIRNAAREPEVADLIRFLNQAGAKISGAGTAEIEITGVSKLKNNVIYEIIPDRIEAATYMLAAAVTGSTLTIHNAIANHLQALIAKMREVGVTISVKDDVIQVIGKDSYNVSQAIDIKTAPYPGFQTDIQVLMLPLLLKVTANSMIIDNIFDQRFQHVSEFVKLGATLTQVNNMLIINQKVALRSGRIVASDVRAAAAMVLLGLSQPIEVIIERPEHLFRGYENIIGQLQQLGAKIELDTD